MLGDFPTSRLVVALTAVAFDVIDISADVYRALKSVDDSSGLVLIGSVW